MSRTMLRTGQAVLLAFSFLALAGCTDGPAPSVSPEPERRRASGDAEVVEEYAAGLDALAGELGSRLVGLIRERRLDEAAATIHAALARANATAPLVSLLGGLYLARGDAGRARIEFLRAVELDGAFPLAPLGLARVALARGDDAQAGQHLERVLALRPDDRRARLLLAAVAARQGRTDHAVSVLEPAVPAAGASTPSVLLLAELYLGSNRAADAVARLTPLVKAEPENSTLRIALSRALLEAGDPRAAGRHLERAAPSAEREELLGRARLAAQDIEGAKQAFARAVAQDPERFAARLELARLTAGEPAAEVLAAWVARVASRVVRAPGDPGLRIELAWLRALAGRPNEAEAEYRTALAIAPSSAAANLGLALLRLGAGRADEAVPLLHAVLRVSGRHRQANLLLAEYYEGRQQPARAIGHLESVYGAKPPLDVKLRLAWLHAQAGMMDAAIARAQAAVAEAPRSATAHTTLGRVQLIRGDAGAAAAAFKAALGLDPRHAPAHLGLGVAAERAGERERAVRAWRAAAELLPGDPRAWNNLAWLLAQDGRRLDEALAHARKANELAPDAPAVLDTLGWVHFRRGQYADAERALARAVRLAPRDARTHYRLAVTLQRLERSAEAETTLRRARELDPALADSPEIRLILAGR